jgi:hypothetical protein
MLVSKLLETESEYSNNKGNVVFTIFVNVPLELYVSPVVPVDCDIFNEPHNTMVSFGGFIT